MYLIPYLLLIALILFDYFNKEFKFAPIIYFIFIFLIFLTQIFYPCQWDYLGYEGQWNVKEFDSFFNQIVSNFSDTFESYRFKIKFLGLFLLVISLKKSLKLSGISIFAISSIAYIQLSGFTSQNLSDLGFLLFLVSFAQNYLFGFSFINIFLIIFSAFVSLASHLSGLGQILLLVLSGFSAKYFLDIKSFSSFFLKPSRKVIYSLLKPISLSILFLLIIVLVSQNWEVFGLTMFRYFKSTTYLTNQIFDLGITRTVLVLSETVLSLAALRRIDINIKYLDGRKKKFLIMGIIYLSIILIIRVFAAFAADYVVFGRLSFTYLITLIFFLGVQNKFNENIPKSIEIKIFGLIKYQYLNDLILLFLSIRSINYIVSVYTNSPLYCRDIWYIF